MANLGLLADQDNAGLLAPVNGLLGGLLGGPDMMASPDARMAIAGALLQGRGPTLSNIGMALGAGAQAKAAADQVERVNRQNELQQLSGLYKVLKDDDARAQMASAFGGAPYSGPSPALRAIESRMGGLAGAPPMAGGNVVPFQRSAPSMAAGNPALATPGAPSQLPISKGPTGFPPPGGMTQLPASTSAMPQPQQLPQIGQPQQFPQQLPLNGQPPQSPASMLQMARAANIPDPLAQTMIANGQSAKLLEMIGTALAPKNGPAGISRIDPRTGEVQMLGGNARPGQVPWIMRNGIPTATPIQGAAEEVARAEGLKADATAQAQARNDLVQVPQGDGTFKWMTRAQAVQAAGGQRSSGIPAEVIAADRSGIPFNATQAPGGPVQFQQGGPGFTAGQSTAAKTAAETNPKLQLETLQQSFNDNTKLNDTMGFIDAARRAVNGSTTTGLFAKPALLAARVGAAFGISDPNAAADPEVFMAMAGRQTMGVIKSLGSGSGISDADREYAAKAVGGDIKLNKESINRLLDIQEKAINRQVQMHNTRVDQAAAAGVPSVFSYRIQPYPMTGSNVVTLPNGRTFTFPDAQAAQQFKQHAQIQ